MAPEIPDDNMSSSMTGAEMISYEIVKNNGSVLTSMNT